MNRPYRKWLNADWANIVKESFSIAEVCRKLGLKAAGGNSLTVKIQIAKRGLDTSHFTGQTWSKGKQLKSLEGYANWKQIKPHIIKMRGHKCECCTLDKWIDRPIPLELHHIDGDRTNNEDSNLQLLCPNCHSQTDNYRNKKRS